MNLDQTGKHFFPILMPDGTQEIWIHEASTAFSWSLAANRGAAYTPAPFVCPQQVCSQGRPSLGLRVSGTGSVSGNLTAS